MKRPRPVLMRTKTWERRTHSHHTTASHYSHSNRPGWRQRHEFAIVGLGFAHDGGDRGLLHLVLIVLMVDWCYSLSTFFFFFWMLMADYGLLVVVVVVVVLGMCSAVVVVSGVCSAAMVDLWWWWFQ